MGNAKLDYIEVIAAEGAALISAVAQGPLDASVPACPDWVLRDLASHIGTTWSWSAVIVRERLQAPAPYDTPTLDDHELVRYLESGLASLIDALGSTPPDTAVWNFGPRPRTAAFWRRRQAMEAAVHRVDAELSIGEPADVTTAVAVDGVGEYVEVMLPRMHYKQDPPPGQLKLTATDTGDVWTTGAPDAGEGSLSGAAEDLFLVLWGRRDESLVQPGGDSAILAGWRSLGAP
ncbi:MAG TPA: maleylpyruvate isomerase family mycothiol-dependent enzyme [Frankiaceae bacterium]|jgi:uncharacterized protein (TIGR03083 family)|nr:maleylpyruvate isomerase family mycothiol-dependent enzyme [Frankiaceae bacterium]